MTEILSFRKQSIDLLWKSVDWFLYDRDLRHERDKILLYNVQSGRLWHRRFKSMFLHQLANVYQFSLECLLMSSYS